MVELIDFKMDLSKITTEKLQAFVGFLEKLESVKDLSGIAARYMSKENPLCKGQGLDCSVSCLNRYIDLRTIKDRFACCIGRDETSSTPYDLCFVIDHEPEKAMKIITPLVDYISAVLRERKRIEQGI